MGMWTDDDRKDMVQRTLRDIEVPPDGSIWRHYKGGLYSIVCTSIKEDDLVVLVTYRSNKHGTTWTRTLANFTEMIETIQHIETRGDICINYPRFRREED